MPDFAGNLYHAFNRGCNRERIFASTENYLFLVSTAQRVLHSSSACLIAYCLMPNHYHFLLRSCSDGGCARFLQRIFNSYVQAFNRPRDRTGTLFEGRVRKRQVDDEEYALRLCRYIHLNPVVAGLVCAAEDWPFSNYLDFTGRRQGGLLDTDFMRIQGIEGPQYEIFVKSAIEDGTEEAINKSA